VNSTSARTPSEKVEEGGKGAKTSPRELVRRVHEEGMLAGVAIKPGTDVEVLWELLDSGVKEEVPDVCCFPYLNTHPHTTSINYRVLTKRRWSS